MTFRYEAWHKDGRTCVVQVDGNEVVSCSAEALAGILAEAGYERKQTAESFDDLELPG